MSVTTEQEHMPKVIEPEDRVVWGNERGQVTSVHYNVTDLANPSEIIVRWNCGSVGTYDPTMLIPQDDGSWLLQC